MKILTIGASPYLLVRNGKMHADVIQKLYSEKHQISSIVWHHDETYFMPTQDGKHQFKLSDHSICDLYPFDPKSPNASPLVYELLKKVQPNLVITIGDYEDTNFFYAIKCMYPTLFKWLAIYTIDSCGIHENQKDAFEGADTVVATSMFGLSEICKIANINGLYLPYGYDNQNYFDMNVDRQGSMVCARNMQASNLAAFIHANQNSHFKSYIHTNLYDPGDYDLEYLKKRFHAENLGYTTDYCSIQDGISVEKLCTIYNEHKIIVDCSIKSATALSVLEAMACGCVPVGMNYGRLGEVISEMPEFCRFMVPFNLFVGQNSEEFAIMDAQKLKDTIEYILHNEELRLQASKEAIKIAQKYTSNVFLSNLYTVIARTINQNFATTLELV